VLVAPVSCEDSANAEKVQSKPDKKLEFSVLLNTEDREDRERYVLGERLSSFLATQSVRWLECRIDLVNGRLRLGQETLAKARPRLLRQL
jgi:hypothetical protein